MPKTSRHRNPSYDATLDQDIERPNLRALPTAPGHRVIEDIELGEARLVAKPKNAGCQKCTACMSFVGMLGSIALFGLVAPV